jgi:hypothetical protein
MSVRPGKRHVRSRQLSGLPRHSDTPTSDACTSALLRTVTVTCTTSPSLGKGGVATISLDSMVRSRLNVVHHQGRLKVGSGLL